MGLSVAERGRRIATFRHLEVRLMELCAAWTPTSPEMEFKVLLGRHIYDFARAADALGRRTLELRLPEQHSVAPDPAYASLLQEVAGLSPTAQRLQGLYAGLLPGLEARYQAYIEATDRILDAPSVAVLETILTDSRRLRAEAGELRRELGLPEWRGEELRRREAGLELLDPAGALG